MRYRLDIFFLAVFPPVFFYIIYLLFSFQLAVILGFFAATVIYSYRYYKNKKLGSFEIMGIVGLLVQTFTGLVYKESNIYFFYPLFTNIAFLAVFVYSYVRNGGFIAFIAREFIVNNEEHKKCTPVFKEISFYWTIYYVVIVLVKIIGMSSLNFSILFLVNWIVGTPVFIALQIISFYKLRDYYILMSAESKLEVIPSESADNVI